VAFRAVSASSGQPASDAVGGAMQLSLYFVRVSARDAMSAEPRPPGARRL